MAGDTPFEVFVRENPPLDIGITEAMRDLVVDAQIAYARRAVTAMGANFVRATNAELERLGTLRRTVEERDELKRLLRRIHEAIGEHPCSDDESLPEVVGKIVADYKGAIADLRRQVERERLVWCDKPEDRLYHAADGTWWMRAAGDRCVSADEPPEVAKLRQQITALRRRGDAWKAVGLCMTDDTAEANEAEAACRELGCLEDQRGES